MNLRFARSLFLAGLVALSIPAGAMAGAAGITVEHEDRNRFSPAVSRWSVISTNFFWTWGDIGDDGSSSRRHNVVQDQRLFRSGDPAKTGPDPQGMFSVSASAGTFPYFCGVHGGPGGRGMAAVIEVPPDKLTTEPDGVGVEWAVEASDTGNRYDVRFKVGDGRWRTWRRNAKAMSDVFGRDDDPVNFNGTKTYKIQARSTLKSDSSRHSGWSPSLILP